MIFADFSVNSQLIVMIFCRPISFVSEFYNMSNGLAFEIVSKIFKVVAT